MALPATLGDGGLVLVEVQWPPWQDARMLTRPNLFDFATSELSQDAFLAWMLMWSDPANRAANEGLHGAGLSLLGALYGGPVEPRRVEVVRQLKWVDLAVELGDDSVLVIEDKTTSTVKRRRDSRYALDEYAAAMREHYQGTRSPTFVYLKTHDEHPPALPKPWVRRGRLDVLEALQPFCESANSDILGDFVSRLAQLERRSTDWSRMPIQNWHTDAWKGFFMALGDELPAACWNYAANARGGEFVLWWDANEGVYPLIRVWPSSEGGWARPNAQLTVRMTVETSRWDRRALESQICKWDTRFRAPPRRMKGKTVRVVEFGEEFRQVDSGRVDLRRTVAELSRLSNALRSFDPS